MFGQYFAPTSAALMGPDPQSQTPELLDLVYITASCWFLLVKGSQVGTSCGHLHEGQMGTHA